MGILIFDWRGLLATTVVSIPAFFALNALESAGWSAGVVFCFFAIATTLPLSLFGYTVDRCDKPGVLLPYWDNFQQLANESMGVTSSDHNPDRRTAVCVWPLALGPYCVAVIYLVIWIYFAVTGDPFSLLPYLACTVGSCIVCAIYGKAIEWRRVIVLDLESHEAAADSNFSPLDHDRFG